MSVAKELSFDLVELDHKAKSKSEVRQALSERLSSFSGMTKTDMDVLFIQRWQNAIYQMGESVVVLEISAPEIEQESLSLIRFDAEVDLGIASVAPARVVAVVLSPHADVPRHLQRLALVSRVLRSSDLCDALLEAQDEDAMRTLFMPSHNWMLAA